MTPTGGVTIAPLADDATPDAARRSAKTYENPLLVPDDSNTALIMWDERWSDDTTGSLVYHHDRHFARVPADGGSATVMPLSEDVGIAKGAMGEQNTVFVSHGYGDYVSALDATSGAVKWSVSGGDIVASTAGGGVVVQDYSGTENTYDHAGLLMSSSAGGPSGAMLALGGRLSNDETGISWWMATNIDWSGAGYHSENGSLLGGFAAPFCQPPIYEEVWRFPPFVFNFEFSDAGGVFESSARARVRQAAQVWRAAGYSQLSEQQNPPVGGGTVLTVRWFPFHTLFGAPDGSQKIGGTLGRAVGPLATQRWYGDVVERNKRRALPISLDKWGLLLDFDFANHVDQFVIGPLLQAVAVHEFGHLIGLDHVPDDCAVDSSMMYRGVHIGGLTTLTSADLRAVAARLAMRRW